MVLFTFFLLKQVDEVTESPNDNSQIHSDYEHAYAVLRVDKREKGKLVHFLCHRKTLLSYDPLHKMGMVGFAVVFDLLLDGSHFDQLF